MQLSILSKRFLIYLTLLLFQIFFLGCAKVVCTSNSEIHKKVEEDLRAILSEDQLLEETELHLKDIMTSVHRSDSSVSCIPHIMQNIELPIVLLCRHLEDYVSKDNDKDRQLRQRKALMAEWKYLALILDRIFLAVYLFVLFILLAIVFPK